MIELLKSPNHLPLQLASRLLSAPSIYVPGSALSLKEMGAFVTPPLGWQWDGEAAEWEAYPGAFLWTPPRRPLRRFVRRLARKKVIPPCIFTIAPDVPSEVERVLEELEEEEAVGFLLWDATPAIVRAARRGAPALPLLAEVPCMEAHQKAAALVKAGADGLFIGPPTVGHNKLLLEPAIFTMMLAAFGEDQAGKRVLQALKVPLIAGGGVTSAKDALRLRAAGADVVALGPAGQRGGCSRGWQKKWAEFRARIKRN